MINEIRDGIRPKENKETYWEVTKMRLMFQTIFFAILILPAGIVFSHCDTLDGPVILAAKQALDTGNMNLVLIWVQKKDEAEISKVFQETLSLRRMNPQSKEFADRYFFETLVRIHRTGEGAPYSGLKPAGIELEPAIAGADKSLTSGIQSLKELLLSEVQEELIKRYQEVKDKQNYEIDDVAAGREYVNAYVRFIHYVDGIHGIAVKEEDHSAQPSEHDHR